MIKFFIILVLSVLLINFNSLFFNDSSYIDHENNLAFSTFDTASSGRLNDNNTGGIETVFIMSGLVNIKDYDSSIAINLKYSTKDNFLGKVLYRNLKGCYLEKKTAVKLANAQKYLKMINPSYSLVIYDGARPLNVQRLMWDSAGLQESVRYLYLTPPWLTSLHNYGLAVDVGILDKNKTELDMGSEFDSFSEVSFPSLEAVLLKEGRLNNFQISNREILRRVMHKAGFTGIKTEWWHFNSTSRDDARRNYHLIESDKLESNIAFSQFSSLKKLLSKYKNPDSSSRVKIIYKIQFMASLRKLDDSFPVFSGYQTEVYYHKGQYKYTFGHFDSEEIADSALLLIRKSRFKDAFIVKFQNNSRID